MENVPVPFLGFWDKLPRPFFALAPLANVTDAAFRQFLIRYSKPHVLWTEFVAADGLCHPQGQKALLRDLRYTENERPIVAQLFTGHPDKMFEAAKLVQSLGFDGLDINMGCPDKNVMKQGAGAACMKDMALAREIIEAALAGVCADGQNPIPVSVKTRLGFNADELESWLPKILETKLAAITLHLRTKKEMSLVPAHWERMEAAVALRNAVSPKTLLLGNGDVYDMKEARAKCETTGCDGVMLGRAVFGNPWLFDSGKTSVTVAERLDALRDLTATFIATWGESKNFEILKKHFQAYVTGFPGARTLRIRLMLATDLASIEQGIREFLATHNGNQPIVIAGE